ncbi:NERD domain-containing protein [Cytobacillus suaedae]|nr:NERD domain-containing protein [Cytobacillus suaedae]
MPYKQRTETQELQVLNYLNLRMKLPEQYSQHHYNLKKGYDGEIMFDALTEGLSCECLILNDLLLKSNNTMFQIDSLIITSETVYIFEVKNYEGDYYSESDRIYKQNKSEITNPLNQLIRSESLLRQLFHTLGYKSSIDASIVFINPEFTLYQAPQDKPFILPTQISRFMRKLNSIPSKIATQHKIVADKLISLHIKESPYTQLPSYDFDQLRKGIICMLCNTLSVSVKGQKCVCLECGYEELVEDAVMRSVEEFKLLFPSEKITTNIVYEWCKVLASKKRIQKILDKNYKIVGVSRWSYYQ